MGRLHADLQGTELLVGSALKVLLITVLKEEAYIKAGTLRCIAGALLPSRSLALAQFTILDISFLNSKIRSLER